jgi:hypothetical protein
MQRLINKECNTFKKGLGQGVVEEEYIACGLNEKGR